MDDPLRGDDELAAQAGGGDEEALAALYERYFGGVYDSALRLSRDRDIAALVVQSSFLRVFQSLRTGGPRASFRLQLLTGAHHDVGERLRRRREPSPEAEEAFTVADPSRLAQPAAAGDLPRLARTAWLAAGDLRLNDYELLDLSYRQALNAGEVAQVLRTRPEAVSSRLTSAVDAFEKAFAARLLFDAGRRACLDLDFLVGSGEWSANLARRIERHLESCQVCQGTRAQAPAATDLLASLLPVPPPAGWDETIFDRLRASALAPAPVVAAASAPPPSAAEPLPERSLGGGGGIGEWFENVFGGGGVRGPLLAALAGGLLAVVIVVGALCGVGAFDGDGGGTPIPTATITVTGTATGTATTTTTPSPSVTATAPPAPTAVPTATPEPPTATLVPTTRPPTDTPRPTNTPRPPTQPPPATATVPEATP